MKHQAVILATLVGLVAAGGILAIRKALPAGADEKQRGKRTPVIVELFTSEGCSSCPSADRLLAKMNTSQPISGVEIIGLEEHVDYWNHGGWSDPFSSATLTSRQGDYCRALRAESLYTPQMVVDGQAEFVGSQEEEARKEIARAAKAPKATVTVQMPQPRPETKSNSLPLQVRIENVPSIRSGGADVLLAIAESNLSSDVAGGENSGSRLDHSGVVRQMEKIGSISSRTAFTANPTITLNPRWRRSNLRAVVFVQDRSSRQILGAGTLDLEK